MILKASMYDTYDRCTRRFAFESTHEPKSISALGLLYAAINGSMTASDPVQGAKDAISNLTSRLDMTATEISSLSQIRHVEAVSEVMALALREKFGRAKTPEDVPFDEHVWKSSLVEIKGELHRIILASHMDDDSLRSYAHAWQTIGELAVMERPITLTIVIVGAQRGGRRYSAWSKGFVHPIQKNLRFAPRKRDDGFTKQWTTVWREQSNFAAQVWLDQMRNDDVLEELILSRRIVYRGNDNRMIEARKEMLTIADQMAEASAEAPMRRSSCDELGRGPCPFSACCYSPKPIQIAQMDHLFRERETPQSKPK